MYWPVESSAVARQDIPYFNLQYIHACRAPADPTMIWGTDVDMSQLEEYLAQRNNSADTLISPAHVLLQAAGQALASFPQLNRRMVGRKLHDFREVSAAMSIHDRRSGDVNIVRIDQADTVSLSEISRTVWRAANQARRGRLPLQRDKQRMRRLPRMLFGAVIRSYLWLDARLRLPVAGRISRALSPPLLVNYLGFAGAPPLRSYKATRFPAEGSMLNVVMGPTEQRPVVVDGQIVARPLAPLFVRADHRTADACELGQFVARLRDLLADPAGMEPARVDAVSVPTRRAA